MGTLASALITSAFREGNIIPISQAPTVAEQAEALTKLNNYVLGVFGFEMGENLYDWLFPAPQRTAAVAANFPQLPFPVDTFGDVWPLPFVSDPTLEIFTFPPANSRIVFGGVTGTLFLPEAPDDGARMALVQGSGAGDKGVAGAVLTIDGNGRTIDGNPTETFTDPVEPQQWLYRADLGGWKTVAPMALTDECPFPPEFDDLWICRLAKRIAPSYGKTVSPETEETAALMLTKLKARYRQKAVTIYGASDFPRTLQSYISGRWWE